MTCGLVCNEDGKEHRLPLNRAVLDEQGEIMDIIAGKVLCMRPVRGQLRISPREA
jgi:hypothetical protein